MHQPHGCLRPPETMLTTGTQQYFKQNRKIAISQAVKNSEGLKDKNDGDSCISSI